MEKTENAYKTRLLTHAIDADGKLVYVDDVPNGNKCGCFCPACKEPLMAKKGEKRRHHFAHQSETECEHAYESMLHLLAKEKIREAFLQNEEFYMSFAYTSYCKFIDECKFLKYGDCCTCEDKKFDIKEYYDSCEQEIAYDNINRRSDLKIFSSTNPERMPIYLEFWVTHASDEQKLHSGNKIIEIKLETEADIDCIVENGFSRSICKVGFYGFKTGDDNNENVCSEIEFVRYSLFRSGKSRCYQDSCNCKELRKTNNSLLDICFHTPVSFGIYDYSKYIGYQKHGIKNCILCENYVESYDDSGHICKLYKYLQIPRYEKLDNFKSERL